MRSHFSPDACTLLQSLLCQDVINKQKINTIIKLINFSN